MRALSPTLRGFFLNKSITMSLAEFTQPEFFLAEIPIKDGSFNDDRIWVYHRLSLSLIEFVCLNNIENEDFQGYNKDFIYMGNEDVDPEAWKGIFVQDNTAAVDQDRDDVINRAWEYLSNYLKWEDGQD